MGCRRLTTAAGGALMLALAGCGATPPQAPGPEAHRLNTALSAISTACGHATEIEAFSNDARDLTITEHEADEQIPVLAQIYRRNPGWIFQGKSVGELIGMSATLLDDCGLRAAARRLRQETAAR